MAALKLESPDKKIVVGLSWEPNEEEKRSVLGNRFIPHDVDISCVLIGADNEIIDMISPEDTKRDQYKDSIFHSGDHKTGGSDFEDEDIQIWLGRVSEDVVKLVLLVSTKGALEFENVSALQLQVLDGVTLDPFVTDALQSVAPASYVSGDQWYYVAQILERDGDDWGLKKSGSYIETIDGLSEALKNG